MSTNITLQSPRDVVSPRPGNKWDSKAPIRPGNAGFEESLCQVKDAVKMAEMDKWPSQFLAIGNPTDLGGEVPELLKKKLKLMGPKAARNLAMSVSMDKPWHLGEFLLDELLMRGVKFNIDRPGTIQFCDKDASYCRTMERITDQYNKGLDRVFDIKYYWKQPRPEDVIGIHGSVFAVDGIGAPGHYSYGAGHAAAASATDTILQQDLNLTPDLSQEVTHACWTFAFGRTALGVHYLEDNAEGWRCAKTV